VRSFRSVFFQVAADIALCFIKPNGCFVAILTLFRYPPGKGFPQNGFAGLVMVRERGVKVVYAMVDRISDQFQMLSQDRHPLCSALPYRYAAAAYTPYREPIPENQAFHTCDIALSATPLIRIQPYKAFAHILSACYIHLWYNATVYPKYPIIF
jgi:hypothetical protein